MRDKRIRILSSGPTRDRSGKVIRKVSGGRKSPQAPAIKKRPSSVLPKAKVISVNEYFDNVYCLNLKERRDKWEVVSRRLNDVGIKAERFEALGPGDKSVRKYWKRLLSRNKSFTKSKKKLGPIMKTIGAVGCLRSHVEILRHAKANGHRQILILEDDVIFCNGFQGRFTTFVKKAGDWDLLYLGASQHQWRKLHRRGHSLKEIKGRGFYDADRSCGTFAWAVKDYMYDFLINLFEQAIYPVDEYLIQVQADKQHKTVVAFPNLIIADLSSSDIRSARDQSAYGKKFKWDLIKYAF
jgi:glycosyl transferase family 25